VVLGVLVQQARSMHIYNVILEITRKCNLECEHCLRGDSQNKNMLPTVLSSLFSKVKYIDYLTISGGEPTKALHTLELVIDNLERFGVNLGRIYVATNGYNAKRKFVNLMCRLFQICEDTSLCSIDISNSIFHDNSTDDANRMRYRMDELAREINLNCRNKYHTSHQATYSVIRMGRAAEWGHRDLKIRKETLEFYVSYNGIVYPSCDLSYKAMLNPKLQLGNVTDSDFDVKTIEVNYNTLFIESETLIIDNDGNLTPGINE